MKKSDANKRIEELERRVKELEAAPREQHNHFHYPPQLPPLPFQYVPQPIYPNYPSYPIWYTPPITLGVTTVGDEWTSSVSSLRVVDAS